MSLLSNSLQQGLPASASGSGAAAVAGHSPRDPSAVAHENNQTEVAAGGSSGNGSA